LLKVRSLLTNDDEGYHPPFATIAHGDELGKIRDFVSDSDSLIQCKRGGGTVGVEISIADNDIDLRKACGCEAEITQEAFGRNGLDDVVTGLPVLDYGLVARVVDVSYAGQEDIQGGRDAVKAAKIVVARTIKSLFRCMP